MLRQKLEVQRTLCVSKRMNADLEQLAEKAGVSVPELIRECVERDLPKLRDVVRKQTKGENQ